MLNKASELSEEELRRVKITIKAIQETAQIIECDYCNIDIDKLIDTNLFDFEKASTSAAWIREFEDWDTDVEIHEEEHHDEDEDEDEDEHEHHHEHHHHHHHGVENEEEGTALEYDINTFVYYRRKGFDEKAFKKWVENNDKHKIIRAKGILYFTSNPDYVYIYESAGRQKTLGVQGKWYSAQLNKKQLQEMVQNDVGFAHDWDDKYQDKLIKLVFIGQNLDEKAIRKELDLI